MKTSFCSILTPNRAGEQELFTFVATVLLLRLFEDALTWTVKLSKPTSQRKLMSLSYIRRQFKGLAIDWLIFYLFGPFNCLGHLLNLILSLPHTCIHISISQQATQMKSPFPFEYKREVKVTRIVKGSTGRRICAFTTVFPFTALLRNQRVTSDKCDQRSDADWWSSTYRDSQAPIWLLVPWQRNMWVYMRVKRERRLRP